MANHSNKKVEAVDRRERVSTILAKIEEKFTTASEKATLGDYVRLTALQDELDKEEKPRQVVIRWKESTVTSSTE